MLSDVFNFTDAFLIAKGSFLFILQKSAFTYLHTFPNIRFEASAAKRTQTHTHQLLLNSKKAFS